MTPRSSRRSAPPAARLLACAGLAFATTLAPSARAAGETTPAARAYLDLRAAAARAKTPESVLPLLSASYRRAVAAMPGAERDDWFRRFRQFPPHPVTIQAQAVAGDRGALGAVARDASHVKWSGRVEMVLEEGAWKLADERWTSERR